MEGNSFLVGVLFWGFLVVYSVIMYIMSPKTRSIKSFFKGADDKGNPVSPTLLIVSIFISWIFAKSVTNAANLGAEFGIVGGLAYATYWLCIPVAGFAIYRLRVRYGATGLIQFLNSNYGRLATFAFSIAILIRLFNEVWSNTSVVGGYYGESGSPAFITAALLFTLATLIYSLKGGLRGSIVTDIVQTGVFVMGLVWVLFFILPKHDVSEFISSSNWKLDTGVDLLLVTCLQILSYPFHDPVLTDRGFICEEKTMLKAFIVSGLLGFVTILLFSFIGIHAQLIGMVNDGNIPATLAKSMGVGAMFLMSIVMMSAAGSTLDSTFSSLSKLIGYDLVLIIDKKLISKSVNIGIASMITFALIGNLPMVFGTDILKATTISGTMVMGLAPIFLLHGKVKPNALSFHLAFWTGIFFGFLETLKLVPSWMEIGSGKYATLLGVNFYGLILCVILFIVGAKISDKFHHKDYIC